MRKSYSNEKFGNYSNYNRYTRSMTKCPYCYKLLKKEFKCECEIRQFCSNQQEMNTRYNTKYYNSHHYRPKGEQAWRKKEENSPPKENTLETSYKNIHTNPTSEHHRYNHNNNNYRYGNHHHGYSKHKSNAPFIHSRESYSDKLVGKVHYVKLVEYVEQGLKVQFLNLGRNFVSHNMYLSDYLDSHQNNQTKAGINEEVFAVLQWSAFSRELQSIEMEQRLQFCQERVPVGSVFNVYVISNDVEYGLVITLAMKPSPLLNFLNSDEKKGFCSYKYVIVVDLEATCDYSPSPIIDHNNSEIIEFPWVVLDTETLEIVYEKQLYIKPTNIRGITPYCRVLTGITEETVDSACFLSEAIHEFNKYINTLPVDSFCILTDGVWDLIQLHHEAKRKNIHLDPWYFYYFNLREEFRKFLPIFPFKPHEPPLQVMLQALGLSFVGKHHCGIDDCHSIAQVVKSMLRLGHQFNQTAPSSCQEDPAFLRFASIAPPGSWKCSACTDKHSKPADLDSGLAIWNKPLARVCRFCLAPAMKCT